MRILMPIGEEIEFDDKKRHLLFNINVIDEIQEHFDMYIVDAINSVFSETDKKGGYNRLSYILLVLLNEDVRMHNRKSPNDQWCLITEDFINSELLTNDTAKVFTGLILKSFNGSLPKVDKQTPNVKSGQVKK